MFVKNRELMYFIYSFLDVLYFKNVTPVFYQCYTSTVLILSIMSLSTTSVEFCGPQLHTVMKQKINSKTKPMLKTIKIEFHIFKKGFKLIKWKKRN